MVNGLGWLNMGNYLSRMAYKIKISLFQWNTVDKINIIQKVKIDKGYRSQ